jgi:3-hydroxybutyrate dehydrogenase
VENFAPEQWDEALAVNLSAPFHAIRLACITTKTALVGLTRAVAVEVVRTDIACNEICPGRVLTPAIEWRLRQEMQRDGRGREEAEDRFLASRQPSRRFVNDENVAGPIAFLCGPHSGDINGAALPIDGTWLAGRG